MEDQYGMGDLRKYMNTRPFFHGIQQQAQDLCSLNPPQPYDMLVFRLDNTSNNSSSHNNNNNPASSAAAATTSTVTHHHHHHHVTTAHGNNSIDGCNNNAGLSHDVLDGTTANILGDVNCVNNNGRWPRQETLTLLEIRSRLDSKFKEANQKGPLWDEVSRIMSEEHGYQRSGKKCREKFENLYKYYKKTKEGKAGRQDGKHYRFFGQLEALYGESLNSNSAHFIGGNFNCNDNNKLPLATNHQEASRCHKKLMISDDVSLSLSNCSETDHDTTSSEDNSDDRPNVDENDNGTRRERKNKKSWRVKIKDFIDAQMRKLVEKQEAWMEKMVKTMEEKERERMLREEEWRKQDSERIEREHAFWAKERAWIEARDTVLMDALHRFSTDGNNSDHQHQQQQLIRASSDHHQEDYNNNDDSSNNTMINDNTVRKGDDNMWSECEMGRLIQLRTAMEVKFQQQRLLVSSEDVLWEEIANKMACFGHDRSGVTCKEKWENLNSYNGIKKRKDQSSSSSKRAYYYASNNDHESVSYNNNQGGGGGGSLLGYFGGSNEQKEVDDVMRLNEHHGNVIIIPSSSTNNDVNNHHAENSVSDSCFRYFMGDAYGRMVG